MKHFLYTLFISFGLLLCSPSSHAQFFIEGDGINYMWTSFSELTKASGNPYAQLLLGDCYYEGEVVGQDYEKAIFWYKKAAENGIVEAQYKLGSFYEEGEIVAKDYLQAARWYQKVVENSDDMDEDETALYARSVLPFLYAMAKDYDQALYWYKTINDIDEDINAADMLYKLYEERIYGEESDEDEESTAALMLEDATNDENFFLLQSAADLGNAEASYSLASKYKDGEGVPKDINKAIEYYTIAGENGSSFALRDLAELYAHGEGVEKNLEIAFYWYKKTLETGQDWATPNMWVVTQFEQVLDSESMQFIKKDLPEEEILARFAIDICDENDMVEILEKAQSMGSLEALSALSRIYAMGKIVKRDENKALNYYKQFLAKIGEPYQNITIADLYYSMGDMSGMSGYGFENVYEIVDEATGEYVEIEEFSKRHWLLMAAQLGHNQAQMELGDNYAHEADFENALLWWHKAAANNDSVAQYRIAKCYEQGFGVEQNNKAALEWCTKAAENGNDKAQNTLGKWYQNGEIVPKDLQKAFYWFKRAADNYNREAIYNVGLCYYEGIGVKQNYEEAAKNFYVLFAKYTFSPILYIYDENVEESRTFGTIKEYVTRIMSEDLLIDATQGDAEAQYSLGIHNLHEGNTSEAIEWLTKAAEQDATNDSVNNYHAVNNAREELMTYYAKIRDYDNAIYWYKKFTSNEDEDLDEIKYKLAKTIFPDDRYIDILQDAANMGNADAAVAMACIYAIGEDVERDDSKAVDYYRKYLEIIDNRKENVTIADIYYYIYRITDDGNIIKNLYGGGRNQWLEKAIEAGSDDAQYLMGNSYFIGYVVEQDYSQAIEWYQKAAEQGHKEAQYRLGTCYEDSLGVQQDYNLAAYWYKLSADQGYTLAQYKIAECLAEGNGIAVDKKLANEYYRKAAEGFKTMHEADVASKEAMGVYYEYDQDFPSVYEYADPVDESAEKDVAPIIDNN